MCFGSVYTHETLTIIKMGNISMMSKRFLRIFCNFSLNHQPQEVTNQILSLYISLHFPEFIQSYSFYCFGSSFFHLASWFWDSSMFVSIIFLLLNIYLFVLRGSEHVSGGEGQRERERESQAGSTFSVVWSPIWTLSHDREIMTWAEVKSWMLNWLGHPGTPIIYCQIGIILYGYTTSFYLLTCRWTFLPQGCVLNCVP